MFHFAGLAVKISRIFHRIFIAKINSRGYDWFVYYLFAVAKRTIAIV